jgi:phosphopantothenoylcysteine synthetase/decarboxylase
VKEQAMRVLVTSGGTRVPIDRVRHIANMSRGTFGSEIAKQFLLQKDGVCLNFLRAEGSKSPFSIYLNLQKQTVAEALEDFSDLARMHEGHRHEYREFLYKTFDEYAERLEHLCRMRDGKPDIVVLAAAVSDYGTKPLSGKVRSKTSEMSIRLRRLPKLIGKVKRWCPKAFLVGFKLLVDSTRDELMAAAVESMRKNGCDMVVANDLRDIQNANHAVTLVYRNGTEEMTKKAFEETYGPSRPLADWVVEKILREYGKTRGTE